MQNTCISSTFSLRCKGPLSFSFNDYSCYLNDRFDPNPLLYSSSASSCCSCCANSLYNRIPISSHSYLYGLRQSNLIQWPPYKKLILNGLDRINCSRFQILDVDRSCYSEKDYIYKGRKSRKGRFRRMVFEETSEWDGFCGGSDGVDEVEIMLSLLSEDVSDECFSVSEKRGKSCRKIEVEKRGNSGVSNVRRRKKCVDSGVLESPSKFEYEEKVVRSKEGEMKRKEDDRREKEREVLLRRENARMRAKEDESSNLFREEKVSQEERENRLRKNRRERMRVEEREDLSTGEAHRQRVRKNGSSGSSYYSFSSGDFEVDNEVQGEQEEYEGELSRGYLRESRRNEELVSDEVQRHGDYSKEQGNVFRKENTQVGFSGASSAVESDWRKKSEKRLIDVSMDETKFSKELAEKDSKYREVQESGYGKTVGSYSRFDDKNKQSTLAVKFDKGTREQHRQKHESETRMNSEQFKQMSETHVSDTKTASTSSQLYHGRDQSSSKSMSSGKKESEHHIAASHIIRDDEYRRNTSKLAEVSKIQEVDMTGTSSALRQSEIRMKKQEDNSNINLSSVNKREEQYHHAGQTSRLLDSREKYHQVAQNVDSESTLVSIRETETRMEKLEEKSSSSYKSDLELRDHSDMTTKDKTCVSVVGAGNERTSLVTESPSQFIVRVSIHGESESGSATEQTDDERLHGGFTASHEPSPNNSDQAQGEPLKFISHEDALGSADRLQKSSAHYVGEYVQKVRNEISTSEVHEVRKTYETKLVHEDERHSKDSINSHSSRVSQSKEQDSRRLSRSSGIKGPSDEIWDVTEPSMQEHPEVRRIEHESNNGNAVVKRTGKSLWNIIGDIVHFRWALRSEHGSTAKSAGKTSPNQSTSSETWFSGHDPEENIDLEAKRDRIVLIQEPTSVDQQQEEKISCQSRGEVSSSSSSKGDMKQTGAGSLPSSSILQRESSLKRTSFGPGETISETKFEGSFPETRTAVSSVTLPSLQLGRSPAVGENSATGEAEGSGSGAVILSENPKPAGKNEELKRRKLGRSDQVVKDRFDEWEEAYRLEIEQRRVDEVFMREALVEAKKAADSWEVPVGAVLVRDGKIIARGYNLVEELRDSTAHAEINCIREASNILRTWRLSETTLYVTLEPCPMCAGAILQARIDCVVWGAPNKLLGADGSWIRLFPNGENGSGLESSDKPPAPVHPFHPNIVVRRGVMAAECADTMQHFFHLRRRKDKKPEPTTPPSCLPISHHHPSKFLSKMHNAFHLMFCL
ncbi:hypothetical protein ACH5RR_030301 [Cinchona calisaya]|uniref:tRNA(adenine(34)) deaminase n=1 Tax=Cinchona calisaya TaxID=153742 RepID=A0ABD2YXN9_9GENT